MLDLHQRNYLFRPLYLSLAILIACSCASHVRRDQPNERQILTENILWRTHQDVRFTYFHYTDSNLVSGLLLRWEPDSILIQKRGEAKPSMIPTAGITYIETVTGNRFGEGFIVGTLVAGGYFALVRGWELSNITFVSALGKLLVTPAILITGITIGSSREIKKAYYLPPNFIFDYESVKRYHKIQE
ncbi:MAG TPA: hypothetical protein DEO84_11770 [candidate division Zixibacteria bacterium]|nr:hypothetical protein [candidate division Zixibacteria bacterium]HBZ01985.1 hypothetical protein [candidate division Zixibacteria bacterium]